MADFVVDVAAGYGTVTIGDVEYQIIGQTRPVVVAVTEKQREARRLQDADGAVPADELADQVAALMIGVIDVQLRAPEGAQPAADALLKLWNTGALTVDHHLRPILDHLQGVTT